MQTPDEFIEAVQQIEDEEGKRMMIKWVCGTMMDHADFTVDENPDELTTDELIEVYHRCTEIWQEWKDSTKE